MLSLSFLQCGPLTSRSSNTWKGIRNTWSVFSRTTNLHFNKNFRWSQQKLRRTGLEHCLAHSKHNTIANLYFILFFVLALIYLNSILQGGTNYRNIDNIILFFLWIEPSWLLLLGVAESTATWWKSGTPIHHKMHVQDRNQWKCTACWTVHNRRSITYWIHHASSLNISFSIHSNPCSRLYMHIIYSLV